jgi:hypothetical protein
VHVVEIVEMNDEDLYLLDDVLEEATKITLSERIGKHLRVNENQRVKNRERRTVSESEVNERETFTHW